MGGKPDQPRSQYGLGSGFAFGESGGTEPAVRVQSVLLIWLYLTGLIAATILLFAIGYVLFQRQEIRA